MEDQVCLISIFTINKGSQDRTTTKTDKKHQGHRTEHLAIVPHIHNNLFFIKMQKKFNEKRTISSILGAETIGYPYAKQTNKNLSTG